MFTLASTLTTNIINTGTFSAISSIGTDLLISGFSLTAKSIGIVISQLATNQDEYTLEILRKLNEMDLEFTINVVHELVIEKQKLILNEPLRIALIGVNYVLDKINKELFNIKNKIDIHNKKYFSRFRKLDCSMNEIEKCNNLLKNRYTLILDLLKIYS